MAGIEVTLRIDSDCFWNGHQYTSGTSMFAWTACRE